VNELTKNHYCHLDITGDGP